MTKFEPHKLNPSVNVYVLANFKQPLPNNCTISMLHIIPNRGPHTAYGVAWGGGGGDCIDGWTGIYATVVLEVVPKNLIFA